jgi:hypothetical protein
MAQVAVRLKATPVPSVSPLVEAIAAAEVADWWRAVRQSGPWPDPRRCEQMAWFLNTCRLADRPTGATAKKALSAYNLLIRQYEEAWTVNPPPDDVATTMQVLRRDRETLKPRPTVWKQLLRTVPNIWLHAQSDFSNIIHETGYPDRRPTTASSRSPSVRFVALALRRLGYRKATPTAVELNLAAWRGPRPDRVGRDPVANQPADQSVSGVRALESLSIQAVW